MCPPTPLLFLLTLTSVVAASTSSPAQETRGDRLDCANTLHQAAPPQFQVGGEGGENLVELLFWQEGEERGEAGLDCVFRRKIVVLGGQGAGKSSLANSFLGWRLSQPDNPGPFSVGHGLEAGTLSSSYSSGPWLAHPQAPPVTVVDTPGFNSSFDDLESLVWLLADLEEISVFVIVFKQGDRFSSELARSLNSVGKLLGPIWRNTVVVVSHWSYQASAVLRRKNLRLSERKYSKALSDTLKAKLKIDFELPIFFIDSHYNSQDSEESLHFATETSKLWRHLESMKSWKSITKSDIEHSMRKVKKRFGEIREKCLVFLEEREIIKHNENQSQQKIEAQKKMIQKLREKIDFLKSSCL